MSGGRYVDVLGRFANETSYVRMTNCTFGPPSDPLLKTVGKKIFDPTPCTPPHCQPKPKRPKLFPDRDGKPMNKLKKIGQWARTFFYFDAFLEASFAETVIQALEVARVASVGARIELESCGTKDEKRTGPLQVVVVGDPARSKRRNTCELAEEELDDATNQKNTASARFGSTRSAHTTRNESIAVLAVWADVIVGSSKNRSAEVTLSQLVLVGGSLLAESEGVMTIKHNILLADAAIVGKTAYDRWEEETLQENNVFLESDDHHHKWASLAGQPPMNPILRLLDDDSDYASLLENDLPVSDKGASSVIGRVGQLGRLGRVALCGITVRVVSKSLVLFGADLWLKRRSRFEVAEHATLVLAGGETTVKSDVDDAAVLECNGSVLRAANEAEPSVLLLPNGTFVHGGTLRVVAATDKIQIEMDEDLLHKGVLFENQPPLIDARTVIITAHAVVNATLANDAIINFRSTWALYSTQRVVAAMPDGSYAVGFDGTNHKKSLPGGTKTDENDDLDLLQEVVQDSLETDPAAFVPIMAGASRGVGLALAFLPDSRTNEVVLAARVDYVDCVSRINGQFAEGNAPKVVVADVSPRAGQAWWWYNSTTAHTMRHHPVDVSDDDENSYFAPRVDTGHSVRDQCGLCLDTNSSCAFAFGASRAADYDFACAARSSSAKATSVVSSSASSSEYTYRSENCCEHGCGPGGHCRNGRCRCTWWWTGERCISLSSKAQFVVGGGLLVLLAMAAAATYVAMWQRRKSAAIGEALDELRDNLLSDDHFSSQSADVSVADPASPKDSNNIMNNNNNNNNARLLVSVDRVTPLTARRRTGSGADLGLLVDNDKDFHEEGDLLLDSLRDRARSVDAGLAGEKTPDDATVVAGVGAPLGGRKHRSFPNYPQQQQQSPGGVGNFSSQQARKGSSGLSPSAQAPQSGWNFFGNLLYGQSSRSRSIPANVEAPPPPMPPQKHSIDPSFLRDVRERLVLRDVLIKRAEVDMREKIGSGTFGDVYRAHYRGCEVAVKKLRLPKRAWTHAQLVEEVERFRAEAVLVSRVRHPNVVMTMGVVIERQDPANGSAVDQDVDGQGGQRGSSVWSAVFGGQDLRNNQRRPRAGSWGTFHHKSSSSMMMGPHDDGFPHQESFSPVTQQQHSSGGGPQVAPPPLLTLSIVTEFMALGSLSDLLYCVNDFNPPGAVVDESFSRRVPLPGKSWSHDLLLLCCSQAARGMSYLHGRGIAHRDLKCANLVVDEHWRVKVCDYGSSRFVERQKSTHRNRSNEDNNNNGNSRLASVSSSSPSMFNETDESFLERIGAAAGHAVGLMTADVGSIRWMAPETFGAGKRLTKYSYSADVYSFGMCVYEMAARAPPWPDLQSRFDIADAVLDQSKGGTTLPLPNAKQRPPAFLALYALCAHRDPSRRPTFASIVDDLDSQRRALSARTDNNSHAAVPWLPVSPVFPSPPPPASVPHLSVGQPWHSHSYPRYNYDLHRSPTPLLAPPLIDEEV